MKKYHIFLIIFALIFGACSSKKEIQEEEQTSEKEQTENTETTTLSSIVAKDAKVEELAKDLKFLEGPIWDKANNRLIFSEVMGNKLYQ